MESFNARIKRLREQKGLSQREMARFIGVTRSGYQMIESGRNSKKFCYLPVMAKALECRIDDLFPEMDAPEAPAAEKTASAGGFEDESLDDFEM